MKKEVAIVFGITQNYTFALANVLIGMKKHCKPFWDDVIVYHDGIAEDEQAVINSILPCEFILFDERDIKDSAKNVESAKVYSLLALARFECFGLLDKYHKVIWHDVDILVQKDFSSILNYADKTGYAATQSTNFRIEQNFTKLVPGYNMLSFLYNSGILVISDTLKHYDKMREYCYAAYNKYSDILRYNDQGVLNLLIQDFGINVENMDLEMYCCHPSTKGYKDAVIIHAYGSDKFWNSYDLKLQFPEWHENNEVWKSLLQEKNISLLCSQPLVSVVMTIYERSEFIHDSVSSILNQTYPCFEFIIVVEHSNMQDAIKKQLEAYNDDRIKIICNTKRLGFAESLNVGLDAAEGSYIARMDDDDISLPTRLEKQVLFLESHPDISVVGGWIRFFGKFNHEEHRPTAPEELRVWALRETPTYHPTAMIRKADLDKYGYRYDSSWFTEDYDLWTRMIRNLRFANIPEVLLKYRASATNATAQQKQKVMESHLMIMQRSLKESLNLDFTMDEMLLLRQPSIAHECFNSDAMIELRKQIVFKIYKANREKKVYDHALLEKYLGKVSFSLKTETKSRLKRFPWLYEKARAVYYRFFKKDTLNQEGNKLPLLKRIRMRILWAPSRSFHRRMDELEQRMIGVEQRIIRVDELVRRQLHESNAGSWGTYHGALSGGDVELQQKREESAR